ncbi:hypothetical protein Tco_0355779 [Tanacetum coccineum]
MRPSSTQKKEVKILSYTAMLRSKGFGRCVDAKGKVCVRFEDLEWALLLKHGNQERRPSRVEDVRGYVIENAKISRGTFRTEKVELVHRMEPYASMAGVGYLVMTIYGL